MRFDTAIVTVKGDIDDRAADQFCADLDKARGAFETELRIDSDGGTVNAMTRMCDDISRHPNQVNTTCTGRAASAAGVLFLMGKVRRIVDDGYLMMHDATLAGKKNDLTRRTSSTLADLLALRTKISRGQIELWMNFETYFNAGHALRLGLAHRLAPSHLQTSRPDLSRCKLPVAASPRLLEVKRRIDAADVTLERIDGRRCHTMPRRAQAIILPTGVMERGRMIAERGLAAQQSVKGRSMFGQPHGFAPGYTPY